VRSAAHERQFTHADVLGPGAGTRPTASVERHRTAAGPVLEHGSVCAAVGEVHVRTERAGRGDVAVEVGAEQNVRKSGRQAGQVHAARDRLRPVHETDAVLVNHTGDGRGPLCDIDIRD